MSSVLSCCLLDYVINLKLRKNWLLAKLRWEKVSWIQAKILLFIIDLTEFQLVVEIE